ncbi:MAG TPA: hypothetical protein VGI19_15780 [Candidatus Cybelea sp.]|jgi:hypothetical protein
MSFSIRLEALDRLTEHTGEISNALRELQAQLASIRFDANDDEGICAAIRTEEDEVDRRLLPFKTNDVVAEIASQFKAKAAENIRLRAEHTRTRPSQTS